MDANFHVFDHLYISSYLAATTSSESGSDGTAGRIQLGWRDGLVNTSAVVRRIDDGFDPGLGFLRRGGIQHYYGTVGIHPRVSVLGLSEVNPYLESHYITGIDGGLESRETAGVLTLTFQNSSTLNLEYRNRFERIESAFNIFQGRSGGGGRLSVRGGDPLVPQQPEQCLYGERDGDGWRFLQWHSKDDRVVGGLGAPVTTSS